MSKHPKTIIHWAFLQTQLTHFEKLLLISIAFAVVNIPQERVTTSTLSDLSSLSKSAVRRKARRLQELGLIKKTRNSYDILGFQQEAQ
tara:strand:+ start:456 stop:719 length:264 start_codon:yes stop_codon:yes gene_type:complete